MEDQFLAVSTLPRHSNLPKQTTTALLSSESAQPWTATRCHRLLRPLLAHIAALRKDKERRFLTGNGQGLSVPGQTSRPRRTVLGKRSYPGSDSDYSDKKTCRKYSRKAYRRRSLGDTSCTPQRNLPKQRRQPDNKITQDVVLPTPFLRRVRNHLPSSPYQGLDGPSQEDLAPANRRCSHLGAGCKTKCAYELELVGLRPTMDSERHGLYESVLKAFDSLLRVTSPRKNQAAGPKSLLAMCLRKVPAYIAALEHWERHEAEENGTKSAVQGAGVSFEIYSELESLGAVDGWRHLCLLVRAHAVQIIQDAVSEGLLDDSVTALLIRLCLEYMPPTEFMGLIETFAVRQYPKPCSADDDLFTSPALQPLRVLKSCDPSGISIMPGILANLLAAELLPVDWALNKSFVSLWPSTVRHVTHMKPCQGSVDLIVITLEVLCDLASPKKPRGIPQTRLRGKSQTTLISAIAALGSVVLLSEEGSSETPESSSTTRAATIRRRIEYVVTTCSANLKRRKPGGRKLGTYMLALCAFLSLDGETNCVSACTIETAWKGVQNCRGNPHLMLQYDATTALMSAVAHHCSRGTGLAPHVYLSRFCDKLEALDLPGGALNNMRVDGAFRLAEHTGDLRDLAFAEGLQAKAVAVCATPDKTRGTGSPHTSKTKKPSSFSGIRWDDGISEWVAATPATDLRPAGRVPQLRSRGPFPGDSGDEMDQDEGTSESESERGPETDLDSDPETTPDDIDPDLESENSSASSAPETSTDAEADAETEADADADSPFPSETETPVSSPSLSDPEPAGRRRRPHPAPTKLSPAPPLSSPPTGGFLAARPRRLSRPITRGGDELGFDRDQQSLNSGDDAGLRGATKEKTVKERGNWLGRNKPARFRPTKAWPAAAAAAATVTKKRVARASLVYLQPPRVGGYAGYGGGDEESDDELSIL